MGVLTDISRDTDEEKGIVKIYAVTKFGINTKSQLNRVAGRAAVGHGIGQRSLVASAYDELGIDMVYKEGPFNIISPEEKYEEAKQIEYTQQEIETIDNSSDFFEMLTPRLQDRVRFGEFRSPDAVLHVWKVPLDL